MKKGVVALLAGMMILTGCGGNANSSSDAAQTEAAGETIKLGIVTALSGERASVGEYTREAAELYAQQINDQGGINGQKVELVFEDEGTTEQSVINAMIKLYSRGDIAGVFSTTLSSNVIAASPTIEKYQTPTVVSGSSTNIKSEAKRS